MAAPHVDLLALLRPSQVSVMVAGHLFMLEATTAAQWIGAIALDLENLYGIMPGLVSDDDLDVMQQLMAQHPDIESRWFWASRTALGRAAGRDWWWALNLSKKALGGWMYVNGMLVRQGVDAKAATYPDWLDACYTLLWSGGDEEQRMKLDLELGARPVGLPVRMDKRAVEQMAMDFAAD